MHQKKSKSIFKLVVFGMVSLLLSLTSVEAAGDGLAMAIDQHTLQQSKKLYIQYAQQVLQMMEHQPFMVLTYNVTNMQFRHIEVTEEDVEIYFHGDRVIFEAKKIGGRLTASVKRATLGSNYEEFQTHVNVQPGGIKLRVEMSITKQYVDRQQLPRFWVESGKFNFDRRHVEIDIVSHDLGPQILNWFSGVFKDELLFAYEAFLNLGGFKLAANAIIGTAQSDYRGRIGSTLINGLVEMLPKNDIIISDDVYLNYEMDRKLQAHIENGRMYGYFKGDVHGLAEDSIPKQYLQVGDLQLNLTSNAAPFQLALSTKTVNQILEAILGEDQVQVNVTNAQGVASGFPIAWTTTSLEAAVAGVVDKFGKDRKFSIGLSNMGAPRFHFSKEEMKVLYSVQLDIYDEEMTEKWLTMYLKDILLDFDLILQESNLMLEWQKVRMGSATVASDMLELEDEKLYGKHIVSYFDWALTLVLGWANAKHVLYVSRFPVPDEIPNLVAIQDLTFEVKENYISLEMDPTFIAGEAIQESEIDPHGHGIKSVFSTMTKEEIEADFMASKALIDKQLGRNRRSRSDAPCTIAEEDDLTNNDRVTACSSVDSCYNYKALEYDSGRCNGWESCGKWTYQGAVKEGCISSKYCNVTANYMGADVLYACPDGMKETPLFDVDSKGRKRDFGTKLNAEIEEQYKELTMKYAAALEAKKAADARRKQAEKEAKEAAEQAKVEDKERKADMLKMFVTEEAEGAEAKVKAAEAAKKKLEAARARVEWAKAHPEEEKERLALQKRLDDEKKAKAEAKAREVLKAFQQGKVQKKGSLVFPIFPTNAKDDLSKTLIQ